jgi:hypothetical protein
MVFARLFRRNMAVAAVTVAVGLLASHDAAAATNIYRDTMNPNGHARSMTAKRADMRACGAINGGVRHEDFPRFDACMGAHGWVIDHVVPDPPAKEEKGTVVHFDDLQPKRNGEWRGDKVLQADTRRCAAVGADYESWEFKNCMRGRGWQYSHTHYGPSDTYIDPDTGLSCRNVGGASICETPQGTVKYRNSEGLNCTRSGIVEVCSSF